MSVYLFDSTHVLLNAGKVATDAACCCGECLCPGDTTYSITGAITINCGTCSATVCSGTGTLNWTGGEFSCTYDGGFVTDCVDAFGSHVTVSISMAFFSGLGWYIDIFLDATNLCGGSENCILDTPSGDREFFTSSCSPTGTYSMNLSGAAWGGSGTGTAEFTIS